MNLILFKEKQILGCYNSTPLKMNLVLEIQTMLTQRDASMFSQILFPFPSNIIFCIPIPLNLTHLYNSAPCNPFCGLQNLYQKLLIGEILLNYKFF